MADIIKFVYGTHDAYKELIDNQSINPNAVYFVTDSQKIYRGSELIAESNIVRVNELPEIDKADKDIIYLLSEDNKLSINYLNADGTEFITISDDRFEKISSLSKVEVTKDEEFSVQLGTDSLGGFNTGDKISEDMNLEDILKKILRKQIPPIYTKPEVKIESHRDIPKNCEIGTVIEPVLSASFVKNDAGDLTELRFKKNGSDVGEVETSSPNILADTEFILEDAVSYKAIASYNEGVIKNDNLDQPYSEGHVSAGSVESTEYVYSPFRQGYFIGCVMNSDAVTSNVIRDLENKKNDSYESELVDIEVKIGTHQIVIACPATEVGLVKVINKSVMNLDMTVLFNKQTISVEGANGYSPIDYNVWIYTPDIPYAQKALLGITLG